MRRPAGSPLVALEHLARSAEAAHASLWDAAANGELLVATAVHGVPFVAAGMTVTAHASLHEPAAPTGPLEGLRDGDAITALGRAAGLGRLQALPLYRSAGDLGGLLILGWEVADRPAATALDRMVPFLHALRARVERPADLAPGVLVLHEQALVAHGVARALETACGLHVVVSCDLRDLERMLSHDRPWIVVCSDHLTEAEPDEVAERARDAHPAVRIVVAARATTPASIGLARAADADGYATVEDGLGQLIEVLEAVIAGGHVPPPEPQGAVLTQRELDILRGLERGLTYQEIAVDLGVTLSTIKSQSRPLFRKLDVTSRAGAVHRARRDGLL